MPTLEINDEQLDFLTEVIARIQQKIYLANELPEQELLLLAGFVTGMLFSSGIDINTAAAKDPTGNGT